MYRKILKNDVIVSYFLQDTNTSKVVILITDTKYLTYAWIRGLKVLNLTG